jgi:hypothetical protein
MNVLNDIRSKIQMMNAQLPTYKAEEYEPVHIQGVQHTDKSLLKHSHEKNVSLEFVASLHSFSHHWETMTKAQQRKHLKDYIESEYSDLNEKQTLVVYDFLEREILDRKHGNKRVKWNGYFIEHLPKLVIHSKKTDKGVSQMDTQELFASDTTHYTVKFKPQQKEVTVYSKDKKTKQTSFSVIRAKLQREKEMFYVQN